MSSKPNGTLASNSLVKLSERGQTRVFHLPNANPPSTGRFYDAERNPDGPVRANSAENGLMTDVLLKYIHDHFELTPYHLKYRNAFTYGYAPTLVEVMPRFLNRTLKPRIPITPQVTAVGPGIGGIFAQLIWHLCDPGDGVLMTTPFYRDYVRDIVYPARAVAVGVHIPPEVNPLSPAVVPFIRNEFEGRKSRGENTTAVILCNPHNPIAQAYPVETIQAYAALAEELNIHLIVDEVFANEVFKTRFSPNPTSFTSILSLDTSSVCNPARIHVLAGPTKDFGASGIKVGALVSQNNPDVVKAIGDSLMATPISSAADCIFTAILDDEEFCDSYLKDNRIRLAKAFELLGEWCEFHGLPFVRAEAAVFALVDLAPIIGKSEDQALPIREQVASAERKIHEGGVHLVGKVSILYSNCV
uniref:Aminotransferase class I/classII large domain-containing protein n=1 Tax=Moniliophthora roreri TaxID=221103 RepID=A0A0W0EV08_MONRR